MLHPLLVGQVLCCQISQSSSSGDLGLGILQQGSQVRYSPGFRDGCLGKQSMGSFVLGNDIFEALPGPSILDDFWGMITKFRMNFQSLKNPTKSSGSNQARVGQVKIETTAGTLSSKLCHGPFDALAGICSVFLSRISVLHMQCSVVANAFQSWGLVPTG